MRSSTFVALSALLSPAGLAHAQNAYFNLGAGQTPSGLSADGAVAAGTNNSQYFKWTATGGVVNIGGVSAATSLVGGQAKISNDGTRLCGVYLNPVSGKHELSRYDLGSSTWTPLGGIGAACSAEISSGWAISGDGTSVVGLGWLGCASAHAAQWKDSTGITADLGSTVVNRSSRANGTNLNGGVVVGWQDQASGFRQGAVWVHGAQTLINDSVSGGPQSEAQDVSADGAWVVGSGSSSNSFQAWRWSSATGGLSLGTLAGVANPRGAATAISADGRVIVGYVRPFSSPATFGEGFLWREDLGMVNLTTHLKSLGLDLPTGVVLALPLGISDDGNSICGQARTSTGTVGFVVRLNELTADKWSHSLAAGGAQNFALRSAPSNAGKLYLVLGSLSGTTPGLSSGGFTLPLNFDAYFNLTLTAPNSGPFTTTLGFLNGSAQGAAALTLPAGFDPSLAGATVHHAYVVLDLPGSGALIDTTNAVSLKFVP
jgi:uncharacterized membrane protein